jgi:hypothetical protein
VRAIHLGLKRLERLRQSFRDRGLWKLEQFFGQARRQRCAAQFIFRPRGQDLVAFVR